MQKLTLCLLLLLGAAHVMAQKVDLDAEKVTVAFTRLPKKPLPVDYKNYSANLSANPGDLNLLGLKEEFFLKNLNVSGYQKVASGGNFSLQLSLSDYRQTSANVKERKETSKDKNGKDVTTTFYYYEGTYEQSLTLKVMNQDGKQLNKQEWLWGNRFFKSKEFANMVLLNDHLKTGNMSRDWAYSNQQQIVSAMHEVYDMLNVQYGYVPSTEVFKLQILDSEKHPDYAGFQKAYLTIKNAFAASKADAPLDSVRLLAQPAIDFFTTQKDVYKVEDKAGKKLQYACLYNLALLNFWLEDFNKASEYALAVVTNGYDEKDGTRLKKDIEELQAALDAAGRKTRHLKFESTTETVTAPAEQAAAVAYNTDSDERKTEYKRKSLNLTPNTVEYNGTITWNDGKEVTVLFLVENPSSVGLKFGGGGNVRYAIDMGERYFINWIDKKKISSFSLDGRPFKIMAFKSANELTIGGGGATKTIMEVLYDTQKIQALVAYSDQGDALAFPAEYVLNEVAKGTSTSLNGMKFALSLNKGVKKVYADCPAVMEAAEKDPFNKNNADVIRLAKLLEGCMQ